MVSFSLPVSVGGCLLLGNELAVDVPPPLTKGWKAVLLVTWCWYMHLRPTVHLWIWNSSQALQAEVVGPGTPGALPYSYDRRPGIFRVHRG